MNSEIENRVAYFKSGNVVEGLRTYGANPDQIPCGGPSAFFCDVLHMQYPQPLLFLSFGEKDASFSIENVAAYTFQSQSKIFPRLSKIFFQLWALMQSGYRLFKFKPDRLICGRLDSSLWGCFIYSRIFRVLFVFSLHSNIIEAKVSFLGRIKRELNKLCLRGSDAVLCHGPYLENQLREIGVNAEKVFQFDTGCKEIVAWSNYSSSIIETINSKDEEYILYVGRMHEDKGIMDLFSATTELLKQNKKLCLLYAGAGPATGRLEKKIKENLLVKQVKILGPLSHEELGGVMRGAKIIVTPTQKKCPEGRCMVTMEGLAMGVPVVAPDYGPFPYLVKHGVNGLLYEVDSLEDLAQKISKAVFDKQLYLKLKKGADASSAGLLVPEVSFAKALAKAFKAIKK